MTGRCTLDGCFPDTTCALGHRRKQDCDQWAESSHTESDEVLPEQQSSDFPWNGYSLGLQDLAVIGGRSSPGVIGLIGPPASGKTSLLAFLYMWLLKYGRVGKWLFSGSWSIGAWESVVHQSRWMGDPPPNFPPHTSSSGRFPGLLHLALRDKEDSCLRDVLFTDAPGEWFTQWASSPNASHVEGAKWVVHNANTLLLLIDSGALSDKNKIPATRRATRDLIDRVAAEFVGPVTAVWTKADLAVVELARKSIEASLKTALPQADRYETTVDEAETIVAAIEATLDKVFANRQLDPISEPTKSREPFLALRREDV